MSGGAIKKGITNTITYLLLINFINLTANFYQLSNLDQTLLKYDDPYDSVAEIVLEYFLEMDLWKIQIPNSQEFLIVN